MLGSCWTKDKKSLLSINSWAADETWLSRSVWICTVVYMIVLNDWGSNHSTFFVTIYEFQSFDLCEINFSHAVSCTALFPVIRSWAVVPKLWVVINALVSHRMINQFVKNVLIILSAIKIHKIKIHENNMISKGKHCEEDKGLHEKIDLY